MKLKKIAALALSVVMVASLAGCSSAFKKKTSKYEKALKNLDYEKLEDEDLEEDEIMEDAEDGIYATTSDEDSIESFCDGFDYFDPDDAKSLLVGMKTDENGNSFVVLVVEFNDKDDAEDFFDDMKDEFSSLGDNLSDDEDFEELDEDDVYQVAYQYEDSDWDIFMAVYIDVELDGNVATLVMCTAFEEGADVLDDCEDFYKDIDVDSPADLL